MQAAGGHGVGEHAHIRLTGHQRTGNRIAGAFAQLQAQLGVGLHKSAQRRNQVFADGRGVGQQLNAGAQALAKGLHVASELLHLQQHAAGMGQQHSARFGSADALFAARQQRRAQHRFHAADTFAGRCQGDVAALGPLGDGAGLQGMDEKAQVLQVKAHGKYRLAGAWGDAPW